KQLRDTSFGPFSICLAFCCVVVIGVILEIPLLGEGGSATFKIANEWLFSCMSSFVLFEISRDCGGIVASCNIANEWLISTVSALVHCETSRGCSGILTTFKIAS